MKIINKLIITSITILIGACASPSIKQANNTLQIQLDDKSIIQGYGNIIYKGRVNLTNINIYQNVYKMNNGLILTYEDAITDTSYKLSYGVNRMVDIIFPGFQRQNIQNKGNLYFIELKSTDKILYLILENMNKKRYKLVYGFDQNSFKKLFTAISTESEVAIQSQLVPANNKVIINPKLYIHSKWNEKNIIMDGILTKVGARPYR